MPGSIHIDVRSSHTGICARTRDLTYNVSNHMHTRDSKLDQQTQHTIVMQGLCRTTLIIHSQGAAHSVTSFSAMVRAGEQRKTVTDAGKDCPNIADAHELW